MPISTLLNILLPAPPVPCATVVTKGELTETLHDSQSPSLKQTAQKELKYRRLKLFNEENTIIPFLPLGERQTKN